MSENYFSQLYNTDVSDKTKEKNGLKYLSWAAAWASLKKIHPDANYQYFEEPIKFAADGTPTVYRYWFDDGKTGWVKVAVTIGDITHTEILPIMDFKNKAIPADSIDSTSANKSLKRCLAKACAAHGIGLYLYEGEDMPEETKMNNSLQAECMELIRKKCALSEKTKAKVGEICKDVLADENGDPNLCEDNAKLKELKKKLLAVRKIVD